MEICQTDQINSQKQKKTDFFLLKRLTLLEILYIFEIFHM